MADLADTIKRIPLFSGLSREDIAKVLGKLEERSFAVGATVFKKGDRGDAFYLIHSGAVEVLLETPGGRAESVGVLGPQDCFGEMALLSGETRSATIVTLRDTTLWRLSREDWNELIAKHPTWLLHFCATLSKRVSRAELHYSQGRDAFNSLAEEYYSARPSEEQRFLRRLALLTSIDSSNLAAIVETDSTREFLAHLETSRLPLIRPLERGNYELSDFFRDFLHEKLLAVEGKDAPQRLHEKLATQCEALGIYEQAIHHSLEAEDWRKAILLLAKHGEDLASRSPLFLKDALERLPAKSFFEELRLVHLKADTLARLGDFEAAIESYKAALSQKRSHTAVGEAVARYQAMAEAWAKKGDFSQGLGYLRNALILVEQEESGLSSETEDRFRALSQGPPAAEPAVKEKTAATTLGAFLSGLHGKLSLGRWAGGILGPVTCAYLWFWTPDIGLGTTALKQLAILSLALIYWIFWVIPEHGTALILALSYVLTGLAPAETVFAGFASTTWFMSLGVLGLGAAITGSGLFYRLSLQLVRFFPLSFRWQTVALGFMGAVVTALIPQKSARATIISQMILNLAESLGYKTPSRASTGLFAATFLGLGQLNFLYLTGATATLLAWGLLPDSVRAQFTWGYWFLATFPPTLVVIGIVLLSINLLYRPESQARVSYQMVDNQLEILGSLSRQEWITLGTLFFMITGWITFSYHGIQGAWISLIGLCILINTGVLGWEMLKKGIDWEFLIFLGATLSIPSILTSGKIDAWLAGFFSPLITPFASNPAYSLLLIALLANALKFVFATRLTVITLALALLPLSHDMGMSPWVVTMAILMGAETWFFRFQIDWHTLAYATTEGKGFTYPLMLRINPFFLIAYLLGLLAAIPYWKYLGLMK